MSAVAARHAGLPFVPQPAPDELLGSWLLRLAQLYGLGLTMLLSRLGARPAADARIPHWFALSASTVSLDALSAATRMPRAFLATMALSSSKQRWPEQLGACQRCLADATDAGQPITWNRNWMSPLATVCKRHGTWLTPVATRTLASIRHAGDFGGVVRHLNAGQALLDRESAGAADALWLQDLCSARKDVRLPWGKTRPTDLILILRAVAGVVMSGAEADSQGSAAGAPMDRRPWSVMVCRFETAGAGRFETSLPTQLRHRQWVLARVAHVLRWAPAARTIASSWPSASVERLASMLDWPEGALAWVSPKAAELARRRDELREELSISPRYFKAYSALLASFH